jgi:hypothetical protein
MKKTLLLLAVFLVTISVSYAQTEKGYQALGLNLAFAYNNSSGTVISNGNPQPLGSKITQFSIGPSYSYFIANKLDVGGSLSFGTTSTTNLPGYNPSKYSSNDIGGIVYLRKYCMFNDKIGLRTGPYIGYNYGEVKYTYNTAPAASTDTKTDYYNAGMRLELVYFPSKKFGFSTYLASFDYSHYKSDSGPAGHLSGDNVYLNLINSNLAVSVYYVFGK